MYEGLLLPWQQIYHLAFYSIIEQLLKFLENFPLLKYVKSQRSYGFLITKELIFGFQILDLKDHFSASFKKFEIKNESLVKTSDTVCFDSGVETKYKSDFSFHRL